MSMHEYMFLIDKLNDDHWLSELEKRSKINRMLRQAADDRMVTLTEMSVLFEHVESLNCVTR